MPAKELKNWIHSLEMRQKAELEKQQYIHELQVINDTVIKASRTEDVDEICHLVGQTVRELNKNAFIIVSLFDRSLQAIRVRALIGGGEKLQQLLNSLLGFPLFKATFRPEEMGETAKYYTSGKLKKLPDGVFTLMAGKISKKKAQQVEKLFNIGTTYSVGFALGNQPYGGISIFLPKGEKIKSASTIEMLASNVSLILQQRQAHIMLKESEHELARQHHLLQIFMDNSPDHIYLKDTQSRFLMINRAMADWFGVKKSEDIIGKTDFDFFETEHAREAFEDEQDILKTGQPVVNKEEKETWPNDRQTWVSTTKGPLFGENGEIIGTFGISRDITDSKHLKEEREKFEKQRIRSQKLETIGTLAGGIAHDFNNILTPIIGYADMALLSLNPEEQLYKNLRVILNSAQRARDLIQQILTFSRTGEEKKKPLELHLIVKEAIKLLRQSIPSTIRIQQQIDESCPVVWADPTQMRQVITNLCTNAYQAMEEQGGSITISLKKVYVDARTAQIYPDLEEKEYACLKVADTGPGMDDETMNRIFEPFFTTKKMGRGTGMGLAVVHGIVKGHNGAIIVYSEPGKGSTFHVYLPTTQERTESLRQQEMEQLEAGQALIMVVEDEEAVASLVEEMLKSLGYTVELHKSSTAALQTFRQHADKYDLVLTDLTMPEKTGLEVAADIEQLRPALPVLLMTGYGENISGKIKEHSNIKKIINKPIDLRELSTTLCKILGHPLPK